MAQSGKPPYSLKRLGAAVDKLRVSNGIGNQVLADEVGIAVNHLREFERGERKLPENTLAAICAKLDVLGEEALVARAEWLPEITKASVAAAISRMASHKGISIYELERRAEMPQQSIANFVGNKNGPKYYSLSLESSYFAAKALGCHSLGDLLVTAQRLPSELESPQYKTKEFIDAVKALQKDRGRTANQMAEDLGIGTRSYEHMISGRPGASFPIPVLRKLPEALHVASLAEIIPAAGRLAPLPERAAIGAALGKWKDSSGLTMEQIGHAIGGSRRDVRFIIEASHDVSMQKIKRLPELFGCDSLQSFVARAGEETAVTDVSGAWAQHVRVSRLSTQNGRGME